MLVSRYPVAMYLVLNGTPSEGGAMLALYILCALSAAVGWALRDQKGLDEVTGKSTAHLAKPKREPDAPSISAVQETLRFCAMLGFRLAECVEKSMVFST